MLGNRYKFDGRRSGLFMVAWLASSLAVCLVVGYLGIGPLSLYAFMLLWPGMFIGLGRWAWQPGRLRLRRRGFATVAGYLGGVLCVFLTFWFMWASSSAG